jgi:hypothetical protein
MIRLAADRVDEMTFLTRIVRPGTSTGSMSCR